MYRPRVLTLCAIVGAQLDIGAFLACSAFRAFTIESCRLVGLQLILDFDTESSGKAEPLNLEASLV